MRGQSRKESLSDSRDLDGSYDQLTANPRTPRENRRRETVSPVSEDKLRR